MTASSARSAPFVVFGARGAACSRPQLAAVLQVAACNRAPRTRDLDNLRAARTVLFGHRRKDYPMRFPKLLLLLALLAIHGCV